MLHADPLNGAAILLRKWVGDTVNRPTGMIANGSDRLNGAPGRVITHVPAMPLDPLKAGGGSRFPCRGTGSDAMICGVAGK